MEAEPDDQSAQTRHFNRTYTVSKPQAAGQPLVHDDVIVIPDTPSPVFSRFVGRKDRTSQQINALNGIRRKIRTEEDNLHENNSNLPSSSAQKESNRHDIKYFDSNLLGKSSVNSLKTRKYGLKDNNPALFDYLLGKNQRVDSKGLIDLVGKKTFESHRNKSSDSDSRDIYNVAEFLYKDGLESVPDRGKKSKDSCSVMLFGASEPRDDSQRINNQVFGQTVEKSDVVREEAKDALSNRSNTIRTNGLYFSDNITKQAKTARNKNLNRYFESSDSLSSEEYTELPSPSKHDLFSSRISNDQPLNKKFKFDTLRWPSDSNSESDSDNTNDSVPLKELLDNSSSKKKLFSFRNSQGKSTKDNSPTSAHVSFEEEIGAMDKFLCKSPRGNNSQKTNGSMDKLLCKSPRGNNSQNPQNNGKNKYFNSPKFNKKSESGSTSGQSSLDSHHIQGMKHSYSGKLIQTRPDSNIQKNSGASTSHGIRGMKNSDSGKPTHTRQESNLQKNSGASTANSHHRWSNSKFPESRDDDSVICISSTTSPDPNIDGINFDDSMDIEFDQAIPSPDSIGAVRGPFISPRVPVPNSVRRGRLGERRTRQERPEEVVPVDHIQTVVSPRDPISLSPYMLSRSRTSRSHKGRHSRVRNMSRERVSTHGTDFTTATSLLTPRSRDTAQQITQQQSDEDYARRLQEEMDMEFALSLHNMENQPPSEYSTDGATGDSSTLVNDTENERSQQTRARMFGLEDIEAYLNHPEESSGTLEMLRASMVTPPRVRSRTRVTRRQRLNSSLEALNRMEAHLMSIIDRSSTAAGRNRRGRRFFPSVSTPGDGQDYEELLNLAEMMGEVKKRGLSKNQVTKLPERKYQTIPGEEAKECHICMSEFEDKEILRILPCFHEFHTPCIDKWIIENATCPVCRVEVSV